MNNNDVVEIICVLFRSNIHISGGVCIGGIVGLFSSVISLNQGIQLNRVLQKEMSLFTIFIHMMQFTLSAVPILLVYLALNHPVGNLSNTAASTPDPKVISQPQSLSETLKPGDLIVVVNAPNGLRTWEDASREIRHKGSAKNGDIGKILGTASYNGYLMHRVKWCNGEKNWVTEKDPDGNVYLEKLNVQNGS